LKSSSLLIFCHFESANSNWSNQSAIWSTMLRFPGLFYF
jgi:hypothetical protein